MYFFSRPAIPDHELVAMFRRSAEERELALHSLSERDGLRRKIQSFVRNNKGNRQDTEDIWQETLVIVDRHLRSELFRGESAFETWVYSIGKYLWLNELRRRKPELGLDIMEPPAKGSLDPNELFDIEERRRLLADILAQMDEKCRELLDRYNLHFSARETREILNAPDEQWVHRETERCRRKIYHWLEKHPELLDALNPFRRT